MSEDERKLLNIFLIMLFLATFNVHIIHTLYLIKVMVNSCSWQMSHVTSWRQKNVSTTLVLSDFIFYLQTWWHRSYIDVNDNFPYLNITWLWNDVTKYLKNIIQNLFFHLLLHNYLHWKWYVPNYRWCHLGNVRHLLSIQVHTVCSHIIVVCCTHQRSCGESIWV